MCKSILAHSALSRLCGCLLILLLTLPSSAEAGTKRNPAVVREFKKLHPCPYAKTDCIADHVIPLACGGPDAGSNLQWQTRADAKAKDLWERKDCSIYRAPAELPSR